MDKHTGIHDVATQKHVLMCAALWWPAHRQHSNMELTAAATATGMCGRHIDAARRQAVTAVTKLPTWRQRQVLKIAMAAWQHG